MMRYYNENPQVVYLLEIIEEQERELKEQDERMRSTITEWQNSFYEICTYRDELKNRVQQFNSLPWYKKMFFKFKL